MSQNQTVPPRQALQSSTVQFVSGQDRISGFLSQPLGDDPLPAIMVIHENIGLVEDNPAAGPHIKDVTSRFAAQGYVGLAIDLFSRGEKLAADLWDRTALQDLEAAVTYLQSLARVQQQRIGVVGFCMGGGFALLMACANRNLAAAVAFYGRIVYREMTEKKPTSPLDLLQNLTCPLLYIYGEEDQNITMDDVNQLRHRLQEYGKTFLIKTYPAPHAFFNDRKPVYRPEAAKDAWQQTLTFFARHLKG